MKISYYSLFLPNYHTKFRSLIHLNENLHLSSFSHCQHHFSLIKHHFYVMILIIKNCCYYKNYINHTRFVELSLLHFLCIITFFSYYFFFLPISDEAYYFHHVCFKRYEMRTETESLIFSVQRITQL